ncbi:cation diffusion facilitator family transporter [Terribacillus saccharophilus]|uniref:Cation diffusion facilitator family transporter n=1 Tax=Terribacillus saccharophilus TaxID=361277 RepID=A0AAX2EDP7_9BACI|nr:cation diffusion facilitator family transporter [Terribacillus goriensis]SEM86978.1 cation diffusion facilitator family transporter [Terribacillus saccharophilus]
MVVDEKVRNLKLGERAAYLSIVAYIFMSVLKLYIGYTSDSQALRADGLNNTTDIIASIAVLVGLKIAQRPVDKNHPYGHWRAETVASMVASFIMMAVGLQVLFEAVTSIFEPHQEAPDLIAGYTGIFGAIFMGGVYWYNNRLSKKINSQAVRAAAKDNLSDALVSIGTVVGIFGSQLNMPWLDPVAAVMVGIMICKTAWDIFRDASHQLTDGIDEGLLMDYTATIESTRVVKSIKTLKARTYGNNVVIDTEIRVSPDLDIYNAHEIADRVESELIKKHEVYNVHVHVEPDEQLSRME